MRQTSRGNRVKHRRGDNAPRRGGCALVPAAIAIGVLIATLCLV